MNTKNIPALVMLLAGFVASMVMLLRGTSNRTFLITLLLVLVCFYVVGCVIKFVLDKYIGEIEVKEEEPEEVQESNMENIDTDGSEPSEDSVEAQEAETEENNEEADEG